MHETLDYVAREMTGSKGDFYSVTDADSEGEQDKFFVWSLEELSSTRDWRAAAVTSVGLDMDVTLGPFSNTGAMILIIGNDNGTTADLTDDCQIESISPQLPPSMPGWTPHDFAIPSASTRLPLGRTLTEPANLSPPGIGSGYRANSLFVTIVQPGPWQELAPKLYRLSFGCIQIGLKPLAINHLGRVTQQRMTEAPLLEHAPGWQD